MPLSREPGLEEQPMEQQMPLKRNTDSELERQPTPVSCSTCLFSAKNAQMLGTLNCAALPPVPVASPAGLVMVLPVVQPDHKCRYFHPQGAPFKPTTVP